jgi:hypothetical protein
VKAIGVGLRMQNAKMNTKLKTWYVTENNEAIVFCPDCGYAKVAILSPINISITENKAYCKYKCKCGAVFSSRIEFRKIHRKKVRLGGTCRKLLNQKPVEILVNDISWDGVGFTCMSHHAIKVDDELEINFQLDDPRRSQISRAATVRWIKGSEIGASFRRRTTVKDDLGFYLIS